MDKIIIRQIRKKRPYKKDFAELSAGFEQKLEDFDPFKNSFSLEKYFGSKSGHKSAMKNLLADGHIKPEWIQPYTTSKGKIKMDIKGLYVFINGKSIIYTGISKGIIARILQHLKGHSHHTSTLAYNIALLDYQFKTGKKYEGGRRKFSFKENVTPAKAFLLKQRLAFIPVSDSEERYLFEIFCAMKFGCFLNSFDTH